MPDFEGLLRLCGLYLENDNWWGEKEAMGLNIVKEDDDVAGLVITFDCRYMPRFEAFLVVCRELIDIGFRLPQEGDNGFDALRLHLESSEAWSLNSTASGTRPWLDLE